MNDTYPKGKERLHPESLLTLRRLIWLHGATRLITAIELIESQAEVQDETGCSLCGLSDCGFPNDPRHHTIREE